MQSLAWPRRRPSNLHHGLRVAASRKSYYSPAHSLDSTRVCEKKKKPFWMQWLFFFLPLMHMHRTTFSMASFFFFFSLLDHQISAPHTRLFSSTATAHFFFLLLFKFEYACACGFSVHSSPAPSSRISCHCWITIYDGRGDAPVSLPQFASCCCCCVCSILCTLKWRDETIALKKAISYSLLIEGKCRPPSAYRDRWLLYGSQFGG